MEPQYEAPFRAALVRHNWLGSRPLLVTVNLTEAIIILRQRNDASLAISPKASERLNLAPLGREISLNMPNWTAVFVASVMLLT